MDKVTALHLALEAAQNFLNEKISFDEFLTIYPDDTDDKDIDALFDLLEHQPKLGGFLGVSQKTYDLYSQRINEVLKRIDERLKNSPQQQNL